MKNYDWDAANGDEIIPPQDSRFLLVEGWKSRLHRIGLPDAQVELDFTSDRYLLKVWLPIPPRGGEGC